MTLTLTEANKLKKESKKRTKELYKDFFKKPMSKRSTKPRKSKYKKTRSWWENK